MLTVSREGQSGKNYSGGGTRESYALGQKGDDEWENEDDIEIKQNTESVNAKINKAKRHTEFVGKIKSVTRAGKQTFVIIEALSVKDESENKRGEENEGEKHIHKDVICLPKALAYGIRFKTRGVWLNSKCFIKEAVDEYSKKTDSKSRLIHIKSAVHFCGAGKDSGDEKSKKNAESYRHKYTEDTDSGKGQCASRGIVKEKVSKEGSKRGREHRDVQILAE